MKNRCRDRTGCETWVTGGLQLVIERDAADDRVLGLEVRGGFPRRWAVRGDFAIKLAAQVPGRADWQNGRLIIRPGTQEHAYRRRGTCAGCGYVLLEYEGAG